MAFFTVRLPIGLLHEYLSKDNQAHRTRLNRSEKRRSRIDKLYEINDMVRLFRLWNSKNANSVGGILGLEQAYAEALI